LEACPVCKRSTLKSTDLTITMPFVLRRWEEVLHQPFPEAVWEEYRGLENRPIVLSECTECGFGRFDPVVPGTAKFYESISTVNYYNADKWEFSCAAADLRASGAKRILDVGCGSGIFLDYLKETVPGADLFGFDLNGELLSRLASRGFGVLPNNPDHFDDPLAQEARFDAISMLQVLEHASDPIAFLNTFLHLLRPGGLLILTTPNSAGPIRRFPDALTELPPHHLTRWTEKSFRTLLAAHGLSIRSVRFEPLPDYLWDAYLPKLWDEPIWPAKIFDPIARQRGFVTVGERSGMAAKAMKDVGIRWLYGVPGHTIYVVGSLKARR
jgi:2-polyprenyl-3-methyl-5-hydroxy-6-metoxy-1,4-benzoquinol methylase